MKEDTTTGGVGMRRWWFDILVAMISVCLLAYTGIRAYRLPIVHDEGVTYLLFLLTGGSSVMDCYSANNHFLNTILMLVSSKCFGTSEFTLRLPNLLAHVVFMATSWILVRSRLRNGFLAVCAFLAMNMNPFVLDFFSLARGYGIALALMMMSLFFFLRGMRSEEPVKRDILAAFWCAGLAAFANLSFLNFLAGILGAYLLVLWRLVSRFSDNASVRATVRQFFAQTAFFRKHIGLMLIVLIPIGLNFYREKTLYYGGVNGFWHDTILSLITSSGYDAAYLPRFEAVWGALVPIVMCALIFVLAMRLLQEFRQDGRALQLVVLMTIVTWAMIVVQHVLFGTPYPMDRTAIHFLLLFVVMCVLLIEYFAETGGKLLRVAALSVFVLATTGMVWHTVMSANLRYTLIWKYDADVKEMLSDMASDLAGHGGLRRISLGINWTFEPSINYYYAVVRPAWLPVVTREGIKANYDYYYVRAEDRSELLAKKVEIIKKYPLTGNILARAAGVTPPKPGKGKTK